ncbi:hypothetical protein PILCRDRAFT_64900 [Piloderma croceum F 1598]|uniref:Major facilitator superfamily (MFS) profile domain-containing protein n=1 Tax=Piloderma croceum (strain F 1598) TaxID=765440 RepID=A0A0C3G4Q2_PILCF|nr:hypothetical protein PILCRDRAFT_64900 [Piloderma croceum F 1598]
MSTGENSGGDFSRQYRSELTTLSDADESGLSASLGHPPFKPARGVSPPDTPVSSILKQSGTSAELQSHERIDTYPPPLPIVSPIADITELQTKEFCRRSRIHFAALCWCIFLEGWNDGSPGPLLPALQKAYNVGFAVVSLFFVLSCVGFVGGAFMSVWLNDRFGFGKVIECFLHLIWAICQAITYAIQSPAPPFPVMILANLLAGFGMALQNAQANGFVSSLKEHASTKLGFLHASYGLGAFAAPLVATQFSHSRRWSFFYLISLGIAITNVTALITVFRFKTQDEVYAESGQEAGEVGTARGNKYRQILSLKTVHTLAFFLLVYVGTEVTIGGWIVTFIIRERGGGNSAGYISSGFFGGMTLGRVALMWFNRKIGVRNVIFLYAILAIGLEITVWVVPSMIENAVAVAIIGLFMGPMYPLVMSHTSKVLPKWLVTGSIGWIAGFGQAGSAVIPFITGVVASKYSINALQPLLIVMMGTLIVIWAFVPRNQRRLE